METNLVLFDSETGKVLDYPRADEEPVIGLDPRYQVLRIVREERPEFDETTHYVRETRTVDLDAGEWRWGWGWELIARPVPPPTADWTRFKATVMSNPQVNLALSGGLGQVPAAAISLPATVLASSSGGDVRDFRSAWLSLRRAGLISVELLAEVRLLAVDCNLPEEFVAALGGTIRPAAEFVGQEWVSADGVLWRVTQARNEDGMFAVDDPATAERESLSWEVVQ
jgi:hypothetical protein